MISTLAIKQQQLKNGYFSTGTGGKKMLILGSCRVAPYGWYFEKWNLENGNRFTIYTIDPFSWNWDINENRVDYVAELVKQETNEKLLDMLKSVDIFVHEFYKNAAMFNCDKEIDNGIYSFGMKPKIDICIPSWNDVFVLANDILKFDAELRKKADQDENVIGKVSKKTEQEIFEVSYKNLQKFYSVCKLSDLPEMEICFSKQWVTKRFFHSYNHVSKHFTFAIFKLMNEKFLHLPVTQEFLEEIGKEDMFANSYTKLTQLDIDNYGFDWGEEIAPLNL